MVCCVKPLAVIFLDMDGVMSDRLDSEDTRNNIEWARKQIKAANPIYSDGSSMKKLRAKHLLRLRAGAQCLFPKALENLQSLIERVSQTMQVAIVISSAWRDELSVEELKNHVFADCFFRDLIIDKTPDDDSTYAKLKYFNKLAFDFKTPSDICNEKYGFKLDDVRGRQIDFWLKENSADRDIYSYVVIDDLFGESSELFSRHLDRFVQVNPNDLFSKKDADLAYEILNKKFLINEPFETSQTQPTFA